MVARIEQARPRSWTIDDSSELYRLSSWGSPFFFVNEQGNMAVHGVDACNTALDIAAIVAELRQRRVALPVLIRFQDILSVQVRRLNEAFAGAIAEAEFGNVYRGVYPIKVNQLHEVVDEIREAGRKYGLGLE
ncbi:MAG TPA: arginine decarboxylase, partial [Gammaproteobacteria bacterium]|nr:arginine decarboxylase [Gammaproteobacteria bacterium]